MEPCTRSAASEEYVDFIVEHNNYSRDLLYDLAGTSCIDIISRQYAVAYIPANEHFPYLSPGILIRPSQNYTRSSTPPPWKSPGS